MTRAAAPALDLFTLCALQEAEAACAAAEAARVAAARRYQFAPHGERENRLRALQEAAKEALAADLALVAARREAGL